MASSVGQIVGKEDAAPGVEKRSFVEALRRPIPQAKFQIPVRNLELIQGELGFVFFDIEM